MLDMYFKFGRVKAARRLFDEMHVRDVVTYNTFVAGYSSFGQLGIARGVFDRMSNRSVVSWSAMITGYARFGDLRSARELFDEMPERNVVCWNAMIAGYVQNKRFHEAMELFRSMKRVRPNEVTLVSVLSACAHAGALELGKRIEKYMGTQSMSLTLFLGNALCDMYAKCGCIGDARRVFDKMREKDVISWSIIVSGCATHGLWREAIDVFHIMLQRGIKPNEITFMGLLSACTHAGLVDEGLVYFKMMSQEFGANPTIEHYGIIVDLLSRAGRLDEAEELISSMRIGPNVIVLGALLGGCRIHGDVERGRRIAHWILELDPTHSGSYVHLANVYATMGRSDEAVKFMVGMRKKSIARTPGCSWIDVPRVVQGGAIIPAM